MWDAVHQFESAAEKAATARVEEAVLHAIEYNGRFERPPVPRFGEHLHDLFFYSVAPFFIWIIKACFLIFSLLTLSFGTFVAIWGLIMRGLEVKHRPIFFDYSSGEKMMPAGVVDLRSTRSAPWVHSCGEELDFFHNSQNVCVKGRTINRSSGKGDDITSNENELTSNVNAILASGERYFFEVTLTLPDSEINKKLGVFMVNVDLRSADRSLLASSKQHSMLPYESAMVSLFRKMMLILPLASGLLSETRTITLLCFDNYVDENDKNPISLVDVSLGVPEPAAFPQTLQTIQIHSAELRYGKEMNAIQSFFRNWRYSCAFFGNAVLFMGYMLVALAILNKQARKNRLNTQPYADLFDSDDESSYNSNSASHAFRMDEDFEILSDDENDSHAWEPISPKGKKEHSKQTTNATNNLVSDDESFPPKQNVPAMPKSVQAGGNAKMRKTRVL